MRRHLLAAGFVLAGLAVAGCAATNFLAPARFANEVTVVRLWALRGSPLTQPSAFDMNVNARVRTDSLPGSPGATFDFAVDILPDGRAAFLPRAAIGLPTGLGLEPGFQVTTTPFEQIAGQAPLNGWATRDTVFVTKGSTFLARSRLLCAVISASIYARVTVDSIDRAQRFIDFRIVNNRNCGYRSLALGTPTN